MNEIAIYISSRENIACYKMNLQGFSLYGGSAKNPYKFILYTKYDLHQIYTQFYALRIYRYRLSKGSLFDGKHCIVTF